MMNLNEYENKIINADCLDVLRKLPHKCVDLVLTDPPYFKIVKNDWDNQWKDIFEFQTWCGHIADELKRVMKDNASLYWFGDDKTVAYVQTELDKRFNLINSIVWRKNGLQTFKGVNVFRSFAPITERILFYDKGEDKSGLSMLFSNPDLFVSIKQYMRGEKAKLMAARGHTTEKQFAEYINELTGTSSVVAKHYFADSQYIFPTPEIYAKLQKSGFFAREYEELRREYEELRREYEEFRRPWNNDKKALDVLDFPICQEKGRFHPTQKPLNLISYLIERSSNPGAIILDPFSGSGTTAVAAHNLGRRFICIEKAPDYWAASIKRLEEARKQISIFELPQNKKLTTEGIA
nr:MAG TPA: adenine-specific methyltransferase [Caudoviricetes sp.]